MFSEVERPGLFSDFIDSAICVKYDKAPVYFLLAEKGDAIEIHIGANTREGKKALREAGLNIKQWIFNRYKWCKMIIAPIKTHSVYNLCRKLEFIDVGVADYGEGEARVMVWVV